MPSSSSPFSIASLTKTFTILLNTPMIPPPEKRTEDAEVPLTDMPTRRHVGASRARYGNASVRSESASSSDASERSIFDVAQALAVFQIEDATEHTAPPDSRMPTTTRITLSPVIASPPRTLALLSSTLSTLGAASTSAETVESVDRHGVSSSSKHSPRGSNL